MDQNPELAEIQRKWSPPAELLVPGKRDVRLTGYGKLMAFLGCLLTAVGSGMAFFSLREVDTQIQLNRRGVDVEATVTGVWRTSGRHPAPMVDYQFERAGQTYLGSTSAPDPVWSDLKTGSKLPVRFIASDPSRNHPRDWETDLTPVSGSSFLLP